MSKLKIKRIFRQAIVVPAVVTLMVSTSVQSAQATEDLNLLAWCDHTDPATFEPFEKEFDVRVNVKTIEGTGQAIAILEQSQPGEWDVMTLDTSDVPRMAKAGWFAPLNAGDYPIDDIWPKIRRMDDNSFEGKLYGVSEKFGYNSIAFNSDAIDIEKLRDGKVIWDPTYKGRVAIWDYYAPIMNMVAISLGIEPSDLTVDDLPAIKEKLLIMKDNAALIGDLVQVQTALATGEVDMIVGGAEYSVASLHKERPELSWIVPDQGGLIWMSSLSVFAQSEKKDLAVKFIQWTLSPEGQALLSTSSCYWGMPANMKATLSDEVKGVLRWDEQPAFLEKAHHYLVPTEKLDKAMLDTWTQVLQSN